ncbi:uncharacterized protein LOC105841516 [Bombyx mori]|uniref:Uncharacterized protein n=1 Tax=Bombyx mori TaxID=7091 RepID=A0A8R2G822_BOMMO|nr:uncharacterized protein LOC105841516 isoform X3 [Bombyx mori]
MQRIGCIFSTALWLLLAMRAGAQVYDEGILTDVDSVNLLDENYIDTGHTAFKGEDPVKELLMYKMLQTLATSGTDRPDVRTRSNWSVLDLKLNPTSSESEERVSKRREKNEKGRKTYPARPQPKWKIKKGKVVGSQMVCYFKLCAFRPPV